MNGVGRVSLALFFLLGSVGISLAELGEDALRKIEKIAALKQDKFEVDAKIGVHEITCSAFGSARQCIGKFVDGIFFSVLTKKNRIFQVQLILSREKIKNEKDIGRAINAFFLSTTIVKTQKENDILALFGGACVLSKGRDSTASGPLTFEETGTGCVISLDNPKGLD
ncbi:MAG: hypothetical protein HXX10_26015 [Rhodoplanes sp.]|uniref:hypothetical protein n=1 Tax=Rhodoplanes sp. TaxID=1968906 RepID=UPI0017C95365|nr:hypothetical protein [Rhodoplanes sp.]NVO17498.1 hypothetical protein [Rhodoplanes sp.]